MNSSIKREEPLRAVITVTIAAADYQDEYITRRKKLARDAHFPGFRPGKVPTSLIEKRFGAGLKAEVINDTLNKELSRVVSEEKLRFFGQPALANEKELSFDADPITFVFHAALKPEVPALDKTLELPYYTSSVSENAIDNEDKELRARNRDQMTPDTVSIADKDMLTGKLVEVAPAEGAEPLVIDKTYLLPSMLKGDEAKAFDGKKAGDTVRYNPFKAADGNAQELASLLRIDKEQAEAHQGDFDFTIEKISRSVLPELGEAYYKKLFGNDTPIADEKAYREKIKEMLEKRQQERSDAIFEHQLLEALKERLGNPELDKETLVRMFFKEEERSKWSDAECAEHYEKLKKALLHTGLMDSLAEKEDIKVEQDEIAKQVADTTWRQLLQYGIPPEMIGQFGQDFLKRNMENEEMLYDAHYTVLSRKIAAKAKEQATIKEETISEEDFDAKFNALLAAPLADAENKEEAKEEDKPAEA